MSLSPAPPSHLSEEKLPAAERQRLDANMEFWKQTFRGMPEQGFNT